VTGRADSHVREVNKRTTFVKEIKKNRRGVGVVRSVHQNTRRRHGRVAITAHPKPTPNTTTTTPPNKKEPTHDVGLNSTR